MSITPVGIRDSAWTVVRQSAVGPATLGLLATIGLAFALVVVAGHVDLIVRIYVVAVGLLGLRLIVDVLSKVHPVGTELWIETALRRSHAEPAPLPQVEEIERQVLFSRHSAFDYHHRLRPILLELASQRLATTWHIDMSSDPEAARARLGDELWAALHGSTGADDREARGPSVAALRSLVEALEAI